VTSIMKSVLCASLALAGAAAVVVAQAPSRPGEMTQSRVWVQNRSNEAVPVTVETPVTVKEPATPWRVQIDQSGAFLKSVPTRATRQEWEYRSVPIASDADPASAFQSIGAEQWEAVGILQSGPSGATVLFKRPR
jgi:hypothetical protein